ncbi:AAA family ATPase [Paracoccaceae bacterium]|nr:AAA family ATPase [Paracoccaceae bacterium]
MPEALTNFGAELDSDAAIRFLKHVFKTNLDNEEASAGKDPGDQGKRPTPICIWGSHGIGKTAVIKDLAKKKGWKFRYCAPAQFEEMGDLHGLPVRLDPNPDVQGDESTVYMPPDWVPKEDDKGPGILLLDDLNRADDRILRGLMQLIQEFEMFSWTLPSKWQIVCTANPEGGDYSVTPMDPAMLTRMLHLTMIFDVKSWARWAMNAGVDPRGIAFVLTYPEVITGERTTPRTLTQFFDQIANIDDLKSELELVNVLARSALDDITATTFLAFVNDGVTQLIEPSDILDAIDFKPIAKRISDLSKGEGDAKRVDRLSTICTRLYLYLSSDTYKAESHHAKNLVAFLLLDELPNDLRFSLHRDLITISEEIANMLREPKLAKLVIEGL